MIGTETRVMDLPDDDPRPGRRRRKWPRWKAGPEPQTDAHPGEPDPRRADEKLAREEHGHAGRDVVPGDDDRVKVWRVVADEHGHGVGLWEHARPRPATTTIGRQRHEHQAEITRATELARECMASLGEKESVV